MGRRSARDRRVELKHLAGLDGLRGLAVIAVLLYHGGVSWARGGFLGVEAFFVLSGFLITSLLLAEWRASAGIALRAFWARRARRLLPALFAVVLLIGVVYALAGRTWAVPDLWGDGLAALLYVSNWHQIAAGASYFGASGPVSPFQHTWSLAIEEQFYLVWPLVLIGVLGLARRRRGSDLGVLLRLCVAGAFASALETALLFDGGRGLDRVYYGADTRASSLLIGGALAAWVAIRRQRREDAFAEAGGPQATRLPARRRPSRPAISLGSGALLLLVLIAMETADGSAGWLYPYGFVLVDLAVAGIIATIALQPASVAGRLLELPPLQAVGRISYGIYLWHFPLFLWLDESGTGLVGTPLLLLRLTATAAISLASYHLLEQPIRQRRRPRWLVRGLLPVGAAAAVGSLLVASAAASLPTGLPAAAKLPRSPSRLVGADPSCVVRLTDGQYYGVAPLPPAEEAAFEYRSLGRQRITWSGRAIKRFQTCPPKRVLLIGDSIAFTLGVPMLDDEEHYGTEVADGAMLGCAFTAGGLLDVNGSWKEPDQGCDGALSTWAQMERSLRPDVVVVELGYRDEFDWRWGNAVVHLGQRVFDRNVESRIEQFVDVLGAGGTKILFLSVPFTHPPDQPSGAPAPAASPARHAKINALLRAVADRHAGQVGMLDLDPTISPGGAYAGQVDGQVCRFDGIHFTVYCAKLLEPQILGAVRQLLG